MTAHKLGKRDQLAVWITRGTPLLRHMPRRKLLFVLNYHRIGNCDHTLYDPGIFSATAEQLDEQIRFLKQQTRCVTLDEAIAIAEGNAPLREACSLVTFDDGYRDNYDLAFPVLRSHGVQGVFFLPTSFIDSMTLPWWDSIAYMLKKTRKQPLMLHYPFEAEFNCDRDHMRETLRQVLAIYKMPGVDSRLFLEEVQRASEIACPEQAPERRFVSWQEAAEMVAGGMALGAHTHRHEILSKLSPDEQYQEVRKSKDAIERQTGAAVRAMACPVGARTSFSDDTIAALKRAGYRAAFSFYGGFNLPSKLDPFDIRRCSVYGQISARITCQILIGTVAAKFWP